LPPRAVSKVVASDNLEEIWYFISGHGRIWRRLGSREQIVDVGPKISITIPAGTHFQFRSDTDEPLTAVGATMPPWTDPGDVYAVQGKWDATVHARRARLDKAEADEANLENGKRFQDRGRAMIYYF
jgi:mannose-6-phosphate isomerase-like protein (cupin superfamily)